MVNINSLLEFAFNMLTYNAQFFLLFATYAQEIIVLKLEAWDRRSSNFC